MATETMFFNKRFEGITTLSELCDLLNEIGYAFCELQGVYCLKQKYNWKLNDDYSVESEDEVMIFENNKCRIIKK